MLKDHLVPLQNEVGFLKYNAFIRAVDFGSKFFMDHLMKQLSESHMCLMKGDVFHCENLNCIKMHFTFNIIQNPAYCNQYPTTCRTEAKCTTCSGLWLNFLDTGCGIKHT